MNADQIRVTWGNTPLRGKLLSECPSGYLKWVAENFSNDKVASAADEEWRFRELHDIHWKFD